MTSLAAVIPLGVLLLVAFALALVRPSPLATEHGRRRVAVWTGIALGAQVLHFLEELVGGFDRRFPALFGLPPLPFVLFVGFNIFWIVVWLASIVAVVRGVRAALVPVWFLALASVANGLAHPALAIATASMFPGVWTSPLVAATGGSLLWALGPERTERSAGVLR